MIKRGLWVLLVWLVLLGCGQSASGPASGRSEPSVEDRINQLEQAQTVALSVGDLDHDGALEIVLSSHSGSPNEPGLQTLGVAPSPVSNDGGVVLTHDAEGNLIVAQSYQAYDFSAADLVGLLPDSSFHDVLKSLISAMRSSNEVSCVLASAFGEVVAAAVKAGAIVGTNIDPLFRALLWLTDKIEPTPRTKDEHFDFCLTQTPQTVPGCLLIQVRYWLSGVPGWGRRDHCYQIPSGNKCPDLSLHSTLCDRQEHAASGCCNSDFVFKKVFLSDLRNMAPAPFSPKTGRIRDSMPITLDGSIFAASTSLKDLALQSQGTAILGCFLNAVTATRDPITLSVNENKRCGRNTTEDGHVLEGQVDQCIDQDDDQVYSTILGTGVNTRFSKLNEVVGSIMLGDVRTRFAQQVDDTLREIESKGMCCDGADVLGGSVEINDEGGLKITADSDPAAACANRGSGDDGDGDGDGDDGAGDGPDPWDGSGDAGSAGDSGSGDASDPRGSGGTSGSGGASGSGDSGDGGACAGTCGDQQTRAHDDGDPHLLTLDGLAYDFQATGEFLLFELIDDPQGPRAELRQQPLSADVCPHVTLNTAVAARLNTSRVAIYAEDATPLWIDGQPTKLPPGHSLDLGAGSTVAAVRENVWELRWPDTASLRVERTVWRSEHHLDVNLFAPPSWRARTRGLLGDFDGDTANEFRTRQGTLLTRPIAWSDLYSQFGASYQIRADESLFEPASEALFLVFTPPSAPALASSLSPELLDGVEQICAGTKVSDATLRESCILDVACSGGDSAQATWIRDASPPGASAEISYPERFSADHCRTLSPADYSRVERLTVPTDGSSVISQTKLEFGRPYKVRAWGTFDVGSPGDGLGDAEYANFSNPPATLIDSCSNVDLGLAINTPMPSEKVTRWGTDCASHAYTLDVVGQGAPLDFSFHDCTFADNQGTLNVDLFAPDNCLESSAGMPLTVVNGGFESPIATDTSGFQTLKAGSTVLSGWTIDSGEVDLTEQGYWLHAEGKQGLDLNGLAPGSISQVLATAPDALYDISFAMAANTDCAPAVKALEVSAAGQQATFQFDGTGHSHPDMGWSTFHFAFRAGSSTTTLTFRSLVDGRCGPALDNVQAAQIDCQ